MLTLDYISNCTKMFMEKDIYKEKDLKRLRKMRGVVESEIKNIENDNDSVDMTIVDLEEWLQEIDADIEKLTLKK
jgi:hypothetical protein